MPRLSKIGAAALAAFGWTGLSSVSATYLVVAGGGGGGRLRGGGGGAGGYRTGTLSLNPTLSYTVTVGAGGVGSTTVASRGSSGSDSVFSSITSTGGGGGGSANGTPSSAILSGATGGSGGGGAADSNTGATFGSGGAGNTPSTSPSQGNNGGASVGTTQFGGGGGGGSGGVGSTGLTSGGGAGGTGTANSISGSSVTYAGGGGGGGQGAGGAGGSGGGGNGASGSSAGSNGTANLGGGGGGDGNPGTNGGAGGSGIVIISYVGAQQFGGGVVTSVGGNTIHTFTTSGTLVPATPLSASYLVVAGGGSGASGSGGGGGAGGYRTSSATIDTSSTYLVTVGAGGAATAYGYGSATPSGTNSSFLSTTSAGGGGGTAGQNGGGTTNGAAGGSGGGGGYNGTGGAGNTPSTSPSQGNSGGNASGAASEYPSGGGGGASAAGGSFSGSTPGAGGAGTANSISGTSVTYAGGGGGSATSSAGAGGAGGGGAGASGTSSATSGTANTGGGGGGARNSANSASVFSGAGGSGIVIVSYPGSTQLMAGGTVTITGGNVIHTFTSTGYLAPLKLVGNSLRFRASASGYLTRTPSVASNRTTWTWSAWVKRGSLTSTFYLFGARQLATATPYSLVYFASNDALTYIDDAGTTLQTSQVFRDPAAWYHIVVSVDTTQATAANRYRMFVNGNQVTAFGTATYAAQNSNTAVNAAILHELGIATNGAGSYVSPFDGYMTEVNLIDGQALTSNSFGTFNSYGVWQPITYGGSYGTNGFYLPFTNKTSTTTLGYDFSPNGNNWTTNNISLTTGATYDSMTDVPTLTSATAANYCVLNPIDVGSSNMVASNANLTFTKSGANFSPIRGTIAVTSGKYYFEMTANTTALTQIGVSNDYNINQSSGNNSISSTGGIGAAWDSRGYLYQAGSAPAYAYTFTTNDVVMVAFDASTGKIWFGKNGTWNTGDPAAGTSPALTASGYNYLTPFANGESGGGGSVTFGQRPFSYTPPTGFIALNTYNL